MKKYIQKNFTTVLLVVAFTVGLSLLLYPTISNWWNASHASRVIGSYEDVVKAMTSEELELEYADAVKYNQLLLEEKNRYFPSEEMHELYEKTLNVNDDGLMGSVNIPKANINLPIFHGTDEDLLQKNVGHIEGSSLPVGGESTHAVISGHRGLPSARLFTDITKLVEGDTFTVRVLGKTLTYEVDQIRTVLPEETSDLEIVPGQDLMTLVTCTPYGINSHRLLVRGHRVPNALEGDGSEDASLFDRNLVAIVIAGTILFFLVGWIFLKDRFKK